jgi:hypothetical protein
MRGFYIGGLEPASDLLGHTRRRLIPGDLFLHMLFTGVFHGRTMGRPLVYDTFSSFLFNL